MKYSNGTITQCYICISLSDLVSCTFSIYNPYMSLFNSKNFSFTCPHSFFTCSKQIACLLLLLHQPRSEFPNIRGKIQSKQIACLLLLLRQPRSEFPNVRGKIQSVGLCTEYTNEMCAPFCTSPNCSTDSSHAILPWVRKL